MFERLRFLLPALIVVWGLFGAIFYVGTRLAVGETMKGNRGIMRMAAETLNSLADAMGAIQAGWGLMLLSVFAAVYTTIWVWREFGG